MFKMGLLTSTALTAIALVLSGAPAAAETQTGMSVAGSDTNARFLCDYGFLVSANSSAASCCRGSGWHHVAVPVTGHGQTVNRIEVDEKRGRRTATATFSAGIYSNTASGFPGKLIAGGTGKISRKNSCARVNISIPPTTLNPKTKYWIEETMHNQKRSESDFYWEPDRYAKRKAYVQYHYYSSGPSGISYTSPWTKQSQGPYFRLK